MIPWKLYGSGPLSKRQLKQFLDGLSASTLRKIQKISRDRGISEEQLIKEFIELYESTPDDSADTSEQLAKLEKNPIVKAYLRFRAKKTSEDLGADGRKARAASGGTKRWGNLPPEERQAKIDEHIAKMNKARNKKKKDSTTD